jgi:hypothetical protein
MPIVFLTGQATPDLRKSDGLNLTRCAGKDKEIVFRSVASAMALYDLRAFGVTRTKKRPGNRSVFSGFLEAKRPIDQSRAAWFMRWAEPNRSVADR